MLKHLAQRLMLSCLSLIGVVIISFMLIHLIPGDPVDQMLGEQASMEDKAHLRHELGLDLPLSTQFLNFLWKGGSSLHTREPVSLEIRRRFPATVELSLSALFLAIIWGIPLGVSAAVSKNRGVDHLINLAVVACMSLPGVFLGPALVYFFAVKLDWFPVSERMGLQSLVLPALSLAIPLGAVITRMTRTSVIEVLSQDYMRTAKAKGNGRFRLYFHHALRNALIPIITIVGLQLGALLTGTVITETLFDWPGIGTLVYSSIQRRDYPMVQGCVLFIACIYVLVNLLTDICYSLADPRVRIGR